jgi:bifunctional DNA-binding transcriptional regulator/antitoxin component of YhaV-PrlF toxin-antitoxin module
LWERLEAYVILPYVQIVSGETGVIPTLTVTAKGQVTLRKDLLTHPGVGPGDKISVEKRPDGRIEVQAARGKGQISDIFGFLKRDDAPVLSIEGIGRIAAEGWAAKG